MHIFGKFKEQTYNHLTALSLLKETLFNIKTNDDFKEQALKIFHLQAGKNKIYNSFIKGIGILPSEVNEISKIPFLPIELFKSQKIITGEQPPEKTFASSGTKGDEPSKHHVTDLKIYEKSFKECFSLFFGEIKEWNILALLPSYMERDNSSLVYMVDVLIKESCSSHSGFYMDNLEELAAKLQYLESNNQKTILIGVSYALLDLVEQHRFILKNTIVMETGGMKGKRKELLKEELHDILKKGFGVDQIHSEYGMTELLSQAYSKGQGLFETPPWMKVIIRDVNDPFSLLPKGKTGGINIIDLANINSCSFIATQDLGKINEDGKFEVLGRFDNSDIRGCNLMIS
jgi:hypothetical protein